MQWGYELQKTGRNLGPKWDLSQPYKACHGANQQTQCHKPFGLLKNVISHIHVSVLWSTALVAMSHVFFAKKNTIIQVLCYNIVRTGWWFQPTPLKNIFVRQ